MPLRQKEGKKIHRAHTGQRTDLLVKVLQCKDSNMLNINVTGYVEERPASKKRLQKKGSGFFHIRQMSLTLKFTCLLICFIFDLY